MFIIFILEFVSISNPVLAQSKLKYDIVYKESDFEEELFGTGLFRKSDEVRKEFSYEIVKS